MHMNEHNADTKESSPMVASIRVLFFTTYSDAKELNCSMIINSIVQLGNIVQIRCVGTKVMLFQYGLW